MGRKAGYTEKEKKGPGRKARKQKPPTFNKPSFGMFVENCSENQNKHCPFFL